MVAIGTHRGGGGWRWRTLWFGLIGVIAVSSVGGVAYATLMTSNAASQSITAGTVTLTNSSLMNCPVTDLLPTGIASPPCTFDATYSGSTPAYLATDILIETQAGAGGTPLYNPDDAANDLQVRITSTTPSVTYMVPSVPTGCPTSAAVGSVCYQLSNELIASTPFVNSDTVGFAVSVLLPTTASTHYQGATAQVILTTHAVQAEHNALNCVFTNPGAPCVPTGSFGWQ